jgi:hypothetical protein
MRCRGSAAEAAVALTTQDASSGRGPLSVVPSRRAVFFDVSNADFAITWPFSGFFSPILNPPGVNSVKAGGAVPVRFSLGGDRGLAIFADGYPASVQINCTTGAPIGSTVPTTAAEALAFVDGQYKYVWKTDKSWAGTCRDLRVLLVDGTLHTARFSFK